MIVNVAIDHRFGRGPDGAMWTKTSFTYAFWQRYLSVFDGVRVVARVHDVSSVPSNWTRCDGEGVSFAKVPYYVGPLQYLRRFYQVKQAVRDAVGSDDAVILRVQGQVASTLRPWLRRTGHPYGVEVVGDPYDAFAPGYVTHPLRPFLRWWFPRRMREQVAGACAAAYVSEHALQRRYPPAPDAFSTYYSSIVLPDAALAPTSRLPHTDQRPFTLIHVGTMDNLSKGPDTLIDAFATCVKEGQDLRLALVGGGKYRQTLENQVSTLGLDGRVHFLGWLPAGEAVRNQLDQADLFVLPSRQEGVSRATIEAMARALPCIATTVGGTAELLPPEDMVAPGDVPALVRKIHDVVNTPGRVARMSARNLEKAKMYRENVLSERWTALYRHVRECTEAWLKTKHRATGGGNQR
jgi:glycosyltransferase involved in cell wall biosynthesis